MSVRTECLFFENATKRDFIEKDRIKVGLAFDDESKETVVVVTIDDFCVPLTTTAYFGLLKVLHLSSAKAKEKYEKSKDKYLEWLNKALQNTTLKGFVFVFRQGMVTGILKDTKNIFSPNVLVNEILKHAKIIDWEIGQFVQTFHIEKDKDKFLCVSSDCGFVVPVIYKNPLFNDTKELIRVDDLREFNGRMSDFFDILSY